MSRPRRLTTLVALVLSPLPVAAQGERPATTLVTHNTIVIARPAAAIWPYIVDPASWKKGNRLERRSGPIGGVGEVFAALSATSPNDAEYFVQNVELDPDRRRTIKLFAVDGALIGFAVFTLDESDGGTTVRYDVFAETRIPPARANDMTPRAMAESERVAREASAKRFGEELVALKRLVEGK